MYAPTQSTDHRTYRHPPTLETMLLFAALPFAAVFAASFPAVTAGLFTGLIAGTAL